MFGLLIPFGYLKLSCGYGDVAVVLCLPYGVKFAGSAGVVVRGWGRVVIVDPGVVYNTVFSKNSGFVVGVVASGLSESKQGGGDL